MHFALDSAEALMWPNLADRHVVMIALPPHRHMARKSRHVHIADCARANPVGLVLLLGWAKHVDFIADPVGSGVSCTSSASLNSLDSALHQCLLELDCSLGADELMLVERLVTFLVG